MLTPENQASNTPETQATTQAPKTEAELAALDDKFLVKENAAEQKNAKWLTGQMKGAQNLGELYNILNHFDAPERYVDPDAGEMKVESLKALVNELKQEYDLRGEISEKLMARVGNLSPFAQETVQRVLP